jgi:hypothetical protein
MSRTNPDVNSLPRRLIADAGYVGRNSSSHLLPDREALLRDDRHLLDVPGRRSEERGEVMQIFDAEIIGVDNSYRFR